MMYNVKEIDKIWENIACDYNDMICWYEGYEYSINVRFNMQCVYRLFCNYV